MYSRLPMATEQNVSDRYAGRRLTSVDEVNVGDSLEQIATGRIVKVIFKNHDWLEVKCRGQVFVRKVNYFARIEASQEGL